MKASQSELRARDLMERAVITLSPESSLLDAHRLLVEEAVHGAPVVGEDGLVHGVVSSLDLLRVVRDELEPGAASTSSTYFRDELPYSGPDWQRMPEDFQDRLQALTVEDAMSRELVMVAPDASIACVARTMIEHHVHRVLVGEAKLLVGLISSFDLMRAIAAAQPQDTGAAETGDVRGTGYRR
jgi:CBS domain-containing protein